MNDRIGIGIIGVTSKRGWAAMAHIPALRALPDYEIRAISGSNLASAKAAAETFGVPLAFDNPQDLASAAGVDLVVVTVKVPQHREPVLAAIRAGKNVYCEWPLGNGLNDAVNMAAEAKRKNVIAVVGLQARSAPEINYLRDLIQQGYVGEVLSSSIVGSGMAWGPVVDQTESYSVEKASGASLLTIPFGHAVDALCYCLGEFADLVATTAVRRQQVSVMPQGEQKRVTAEDQVAVSGRLKNGSVVSIHYRGGVSQGTNFLWEINGTEGDLQVTSGSGLMQMSALAIFGRRGNSEGIQPLEIPATYWWAPRVSVYAQNVAQAYARLSGDLKAGSHNIPTFQDAVARHCLLESIDKAAQSGTRQVLGDTKV